MNKTITEPVFIEKLIPGGQSLATLADGKKIFLWNVLPGETATKIQLTKTRVRMPRGLR